MDSALWGTLRDELLLLIFARLPLPQLVSLRRSSLEEKWHINLGDSEFTRLCAQTHPSSCALISAGATRGHYDVAVLHGVLTTSWLTLKINMDGLYRTGVCSFDGGLVCLTFTLGSDYYTGALVIVVANPLTGDYRVLRGHGVQSIRLRMMQLEVDRNTKSYRVIVLVYTSDYGCETEAMLFHSRTDVRTNSRNSSSLEDFLGVRHMHVNPINYNGIPNRGTLVPAILDCRTGKLVLIDDHDFLVCELCPCGYAFVKDRLFLLHLVLDDREVLSQITISEHQVQVQIDGRCSWPKIKDYQFDQIQLGGNFPLSIEHESLIACQGFLLVDGSYSTQVADGNNTRPVYCKFSWFHSLSTGDWLDLRKQRDGHEILKRPLFMCEVQWDAVP